MVWLRAVLFSIIVATPGCAVTVHEQLPSNEELVSSPRKESFADLITAPGQRYAVSNTPAPIEGPIPSNPPAPLIIRPQPNPRPAEDVSPPEKQFPVPTHPEVPGPSNATPLGGSPFSPPPKPDTPFLASARAFQDGRADLGQEQLRSLPTTNQELLAKLLPAAAKSAIGNLNDPKEAGEIFNRIEAAADQLRPRTELKIDVLRMCSKLIAFGEYDSIPTGVGLRPGQFVIFYAEVKGVVPEVITVKGEPIYHVNLAAVFRLRYNGSVVETTDKFNQKTRSPARDIFVPFIYTLPTQPGYYTAEMELTDTAGRRAKRSLEFRIDEWK